jgi:hypothetical protein
MPYGIASGLLEKLGTTTLMRTIFNDIQEAIPGNDETVAWVKHRREFIRISECLFSILAGLLGGIIASWLTQGASEPSYHPRRLRFDRASWVSAVL